MRSMFEETVIGSAAGRAARFWRNLQLRAFTMLSAGNAFIGCQYFTVRGLRTLNGKMIQHGLGRACLEALASRRASVPATIGAGVARPGDPPAGAGAADPLGAVPLPTRISYYHFMDESYHFNSSGIISHDVLSSLPPPTAFERWVADRAIWGCQKDHFNFSVAVKGIFWHDPALFGVILKLLRSRAFGMSGPEALEMLRRCFAEESDGLHEAFRVHREAVESYKAYVEPLPHVSAANKEMRLISRSTIAGYLDRNRAALASFEAPA
jgi:hypothetical protein